MSRKYISEFFDVLTDALQPKLALSRHILDNRYKVPPYQCVSLDAHELGQQILTPNPEVRPTLYNIVDHTFFARGTVLGFIPVSAHDAPPNFCHLSPLVLQANLARLRQMFLLRSRLSALFRCPNSLFPLGQLFRRQVI
jgi:cell cycle serine/threonine-protein kinase CDC5/MSD2